ncbi:MAG: mycothiol system anti-sigma-R factor [Egibacteraceae bacterium]
MSDCDEVLERLDRYLDGECPEDLEAIVRAHLDECSPCLDRADFQRKLRALIASKCRDAAPSGLLDRIIMRLDHA